MDTSLVRPIRATREIIVSPPGDISSAKHRLVSGHGVVDHLALTHINRSDGAGRKPPRPFGRRAGTLWILSLNSTERLGGHRHQDPQAQICLRA